MEMNNKEQLLYFFLQGKISLSQYDYKFMANLQTMIRDKNRITSNQAGLFDKLISKYKKQLTKNGYDISGLQSLAWKTDLVESTDEYTGASVSIKDDGLVIRVPFNKTFINSFREIKNNPFVWDKEFKLYIAPFSTNAFKIAATKLYSYFPSVRFCDESQAILNDLAKYEAEIWDPTLTKVGDQLIVAAASNVLAELLSEVELKLDSATLFKLSQMGVAISPELQRDDPRLRFASSRVYEIDLKQVETVISWMKALGCKNVVLGRGLRNIINQEGLTHMIEKYGMASVGPMSFGKLPEGLTMMIQHTSNIDTRAYSGTISKTVVLKDSRPIEVK
jgi:hypothetical protein